MAQKQNFTPSSTTNTVNGERNDVGVTATTNTTALTTDTCLQQFPIRLIKKPDTKFSVMRFNNNDFVPLTQWQNVKIWREKMDEQTDSENYNKTQRFFRRRMTQQKAHNKTDQNPWILSVNGKKGKKYRGIRAGGIGQHSSYYVFKTAADGAIEAQRLDEFYNFQSISRFTPLTAEEAEEAYKRRKRVLNLFTIMTQKRLAGDEKDYEMEDITAAAATTTKKPTTSNDNLKISDMDEWMSSSDCETDNDLNVNGEDTKKIKDIDVDGDGEVTKKRKTVKSRVGNKHDLCVEKDALEDSDDGDVDGREMDYDTGTSDGEHDIDIKCAMKSVAEEDALRNLLNSEDDDDTDDSDEAEAQNPNKKDESPKETAAKKQIENVKTQKKHSKKILLKKGTGAANLKHKGGIHKPKLCLKKVHNVVATNKMCSKGNNNISEVTTTEHLNPLNVPTTPTLTEPNEMPIDQTEAINVDANENDENYLEEITKRYLSRKPMSAAELLHKMKTKYFNLANEELLEKMALVLKKINPVKSMSKGKMLFSLEKRN